MSLETTIAALVTAANNLTSAVNTKIGAIDAKVLEAVSAVPTQLANTMYRGVYVDAVNGSDANTGLNFANAKKTIVAAAAVIPSGGYGVIYLKAGAVYSIVGNTDVYCANKIIYITPDSFTYNDRNSYTEIRSEPAVLADGTLSGGGFFIGMKGMVHLIGCRLSTVKFTAAHTGKVQNIWTTSFFKSNSSFGTVVMQHCSSDIWNGPMAYQHSAGSFGKVDLFMRNVLLTKMDISALPVNTGFQYMMGSYGNAPIPYSMYGVEMARSGFPTWASAISGDLTNVITNLKD